MPVITRLEFQKRNKERVNVYLDGEFAFGLTLNAALPLKSGQELTPEALQALKAQDTFERAYIKALNFLSYRVRSEWEVRQNLKKRTKANRDLPDDAVIDTVLDRLRAKGYVNDVDFAAEWIDNRRRFRPRGRWALATELRQKRLSQAIIDQALAGFDDDAAAAALAARQAPKLSKLDYQTFRHKLGQFLARRGFSYDTIKPAVADAWESLRAADTEP